jgi:uncharacterized iron-regulated membrane protein
MSVKKIVSTVHLWLGITTGPLVILLALTGCIYAFQEEIQNATQPYKYVDKQSQPFLKPSQLASIAKKSLPGKEAHSVTYKKGEHAAIVSFHNRNPQYYYKVFLNPYNGEVLKVKDMESDFFRFVLMGHFYFWLPPKVGQPIVAITTLLFIVAIISGLILWWPKNKNGTKQRFSIRWNSKWKRRNYDLHNVLGFYILVFGLILAMTGLVWGFKWFANSVYYTASGGGQLISYYEPSSDTTKQVSPNTPSVDLVWNKMKKEYPDAGSIEIHYPEDAHSAIAANANPESGTYWRTDFRYFDQYTLKEISVNHLYGKFNNASGADKLMRMNYDLHIGAILGLPGKILVFFASLVIGSLPITGFLIWWGRKKKKNISKIKLNKEKEYAIGVQ